MQNSYFYAQANKNALKQANKAVLSGSMGPYFFQGEDK